jgi:hypothetical protein
MHVHARWLQFLLFMVKKHRRRIHAMQCSISSIALYDGDMWASSVRSFAELETDERTLEWN